jgi:Holliday junction resolvasome RuvABC endonuclease subunit
VKQNLLALDLAKRVGVAVFVPPFHPLSLPLAPARYRGLIKIGAKQFKSRPREYGPLFDEFAQWMDRMLDKFDPRYVVFEGPGAGGFKQMASQRIVVGMAAVCEMVAWKRRVPVISEYAPSSIKKHATGNGRSPAAEVKKAAEAAGFQCEGADEAVALWCGDKMVCEILRMARAGRGGRRAA